CYNNKDQDEPGATHLNGNLNFLRPGPRRFRRQNCAKLPKVRRIYAEECKFASPGPRPIKAKGANEVLPVAGPKSTATYYYGKNYRSCKSKRRSGKNHFGHQPGGQFCRIGV